jgi:hypothetical protein
MAKKKSTAQVNVFMEGGIIQNIELPAGVRVTVYDYDVEGVDADRIEKDGKGDECTIATWEPQEPAREKNGIITRRYFVTAPPASDGLTIDVRTSSRISGAQAQANAEDFAARKLKSKSVNATEIDIYSDVKPDYSIGPRK